jgi:predicted HTH domain antitoxin
VSRHNHHPRSKGYALPSPKAGRRLPTLRRLSPFGSGAALRALGSARSYADKHLISIDKADRYSTDMSKSLTLEIPGNVVDALRLPELEKLQRLRMELAVSLYSRGILGLGKSAQLANLSRDDMNHVLAERKVPMHYGPEELAEDLQYGRGGQ